MRRNSECVNNNDNQYKPTKVSRMLKEYFDENGMKQSEIAKELGFSNNGAVSKRLNDMERRFLEMIK